MSETYKADNVYITIGLLLYVLIILFCVWLFWSFLEKDIEPSITKRKIFACQAEGFYAQVVQLNGTVDVRCCPTAEACWGYGMVMNRRLKWFGKGAKK